MNRFWVQVLDPDLIPEFDPLQVNYPTRSNLSSEPDPVCLQKQLEPVCF